MFYKSAIFVSFVLIAGCSSNSYNQPDVIGEFVFSGPISTEAEQPSMRWLYGIVVNEKFSDVTEVKFSCPNIEGTNFKSSKSELNALRQNAYSVEGPLVVVNPQEAKWLYEKSTTRSLCKADFVRVGRPDVSIFAPVEFSEQAKLILVKMMTETHENNLKEKQ